MSDSSWVDHLPSNEKRKLRQRLRSPEEYERLREKVKGPEDMDRELKRGEQMAEILFTLETEPQMRERLKGAVEKDIREQGMEKVFDKMPSTPENRQAMEQGKFDVAVDTHPDTKADALMAVPEGNIQEKLPIKPVFSEQYVAGLNKLEEEGEMIAILIDGELCGYMTVDRGVSEEGVAQHILESDDVQNCLKGRKVVRYVYNHSERFSIFTK